MADPLVRRTDPFAPLYFLGWHDQFGLPAVALMLLVSFMVIYFILHVLPGPVRVVHRVSR